MGHDASKVVLGGTQSSIKEVGNRRGEIVAGKAVRQKSDGTISSLAADGQLIGISVGRDLSNAGHTAIAYRGMEVPVLLEAAFTPVIGAVVYLSNTTGNAAASSTTATAVNAIYKTSIKSGLPEGGGTSVACALIDFPGGL